MNQQLKSAFAAFLALSVLMAAPVAAAPSIVTSTTGATPTASEFQAGDTLTDIGNDSVSTVVQMNATTGADSNVTKVAVRHNGTGQLVAVNDSGNVLSTNGDYANVNHTINHGELADLERGINDNVTLEVRMTNNTTMSDPATTNVTGYAETDDSYSVEYVSAEDVGSNGIVELTESEGYSIRGNNISAPWQNDYSDLSTTRNVTENTTVVMALGDSNVSEDFSDATDDTNPLPGAGSSAESGDRLWSMTVTADGEAVPVYYEQAPDSVDSNETHAIYTEDHGGTPSVLVKNHGSNDTVDIAMIGSADVGQVIDAYGYSAVGSLVNPMNLLPTDALSVLSIGSFEAPRFAAGA